MKLSFRLSIATIFLFLFVQIAFPQTLIAIPSNPITSIDVAKKFLSENASHNWLLISVATVGNYYALTFEGRSEAIRISKSIIFDFGVDPEAWQAYITYSDMTKQIIPYLGTNGISTVDPTLNPYGICPLVATLKFDLKAPAKLRLTIVGRNQESFNLTHNFTEITAHYPKVPVLGLYENFLNTIVLSILSPDNTVRFEETIQIQTSAYPNIATINVSKNEYNDDQTHLILMQFHIYDQQGFLRWTRDDTARSSNTDLFPISGQKFLYQLTDGDTTKIRMINYLGETIQDYTLANGTHHEMIEKTPGGNLLFGTATVGGYDDGVTEIDRVTGQVVRFWDMADYVDKNRPKNWYIRNNPYDPYCWFHLNTVRYNPLDNTLVISGRQQNAVIKIGYDDGQTKWILANHKNWTDTHKPYLLKPLNFNTTLHEDQDWTYLQHTSVPLANGNVMIFDNGASRPGFTYDSTQDLRNILGLEWAASYSGNDGPAYGYVRAVEYKVDAEKKTVEKVWEYTDFPTIPTYYVGSVYPMDDEHVMIGYGEHKTVSVFNKNTKKTLFMGHFKKPVDFFYRSYPIDLYPKIEYDEKGTFLIGSNALCLIATIVFSIFAF